VQASPWTVQEGPGSSSPDLHVWSSSRSWLGDVESGVGSWTEGGSGTSAGSVEAFAETGSRGCGRRRAVRPSREPTMGLRKLVRSLNLTYSIFKSRICSSYLVLHLTLPGSSHWPAVMYLMYYRRRASTQASLSSGIDTGVARCTILGRRFTERSLLNPSTVLGSPGL